MALLIAFDRPFSESCRLSASLPASISACAAALKLDMKLATSASDVPSGNSSFRLVLNSTESNKPSIYFCMAAVLWLKSNPPSLSNLIRSVMLTPSIFFARSIAFSSMLNGSPLPLCMSLSSPMASFMPDRDSVSMSMPFFASSLPVTASANICRNIACKPAVAPAAFISSLLISPRAFTARPVYFPDSWVRYFSQSSPNRSCSVDIVFIETPFSFTSAMRLTIFSARLIASSSFASGSSTSPSPIHCFTCSVSPAYFPVVSASSNFLIVSRNVLICSSIASSLKSIFDPSNPARKSCSGLSLFFARSTTSSSSSRSVFSPFEISSSTPCALFALFTAVLNSFSASLSSFSGSALTFVPNICPSVMLFSFSRLAISVSYLVSVASSAPSEAAASLSAFSISMRLSMTAS